MELFIQVIGALCAFEAAVFIICLLAEAVPHHEPFSVPKMTTKAVMFTTLAIWALSLLSN